MTDLDSFCFKEDIFDWRELVFEKLVDSLKELIWFHRVINTEWDEGLGWNDEVYLFLLSQEWLKFLETHLFYQDRLSWGYAATTCKAIIESDSSLGLLLTFLDDFWLDAVLRRCDVIVDLCQFDYPCKHVD